MVEFVNAKINIGLQIVRRREDGYHDLQTLFYPIGIHAGTPRNPESFCDVLEIIPYPSSGVSVEVRGREVNCKPEDNLVSRALRAFESVSGEPLSGLKIILEKHLPDGAGLGGGSADASFTLRMLNDLYSSENRFSKDQLAEIALKLGADCPFFIYNMPMYATGVGEILTPVELDLSGFHVVVVKPGIYVSTREAFAGVIPKSGNVDLRELRHDNIEEWQGIVKNDFEDSIFPAHPELKKIKEELIGAGAVYASMSGSGSSIYGIFKEKWVAEEVKSKFKGKATIEGTYLLEL